MSAARALLAAIHADVIAACDAGALVGPALAQLPAGTLAHPALHVLALGKAAAPMAAALPALAPTARGLVLTSAAATAVPLPAGFHLLHGDHPTPGPASVAAGTAARDFVTHAPPGAPLVVLLSGGGSAIACLPAPGLDLPAKQALTRAVMASGASITALNVVRKHLSAIKGGRLGARARGPVHVRALSDVIGDDPATIASGPFSPDPSSYADALAIARACAAEASPTALAHLAAGAAGQLPETPKTAAALAHVDYAVLAGPGQVAAAALAAARARGLAAQRCLPDTEAEVAEVARAFAAAVAGLAPGQLLIGNGEPRIALPARPGRGGRATHLALLVARALEGRDQVAFLAAGTDDRDGASDATGALVDGNTCARIRAAALDPDTALAAHDSASALAAAGDLVHAPGRSNLLDLYLLLRVG